jgi:hypothetical protein
VCDDADSHELLSVVTTVHHQRVGKTLNDWALCLSESLLRISTGGVRDVHWCSDLDIIAIEDFRVSPNVPSAEPMPLVPKSSCRMSSIVIVCIVSHWEILRQRDITDLNILVTPFVEEL